MRKIMRATLHDHAPNTYYGQWPGERPLFSGPRIARHCPSLPIMSSLRAPDSWPLAFGARISQGIARCRVGNLGLDHKEKSARLAKGRASGDKAAHRFSLKLHQPTASG